MYTLDSNTLALLNFNGNTIDETGRIWKASSGVTSNQKLSKFSGSIYFPASEVSYLTTPMTSDLQLGLCDWTIETWAYCTSRRTVEWIVNFYNDNRNYFGIALLNGVVQSQITIDGKDYIINSDALRLEQWYHLAFVRKENQLYLFVDGKLKGTLAFSQMIPVWKNEVSIGDAWWGNSLPYSNTLFDGYLNELRISNVARWTNDFNVSPVFPNGDNLKAEGDVSTINLSWSATNEVSGFNIKRSTTSGGPYTTIATNVSSTSYSDVAVIPGTTYYYIVTAITASGQCIDSNEASATPKSGTVPPQTNGNVLLRIVLTDSSEREYLLKNDDANAFVSWYNRTVNTGNTCYKFTDLIDGSTEYLAFEKIISFKTLTLK